MKLDKSPLLGQLTTAITFLKRFRFVIAFTIFSAMYGYVLMQVSAIDAKQPTEKQISEKATAAPQTKVDEKLVEQITSLEDQNVQVQTIFNEARKNPFSE